MFKLYNTMSRIAEEVRPLQPDLVKMYTCGPTVYRDPHVGNFRSYFMADWIRRVLEYQQVPVLHVKNITDVGHMRQDMLERGEDKVIAEARARGIRPKQIAEYYTERFMSDEKKLNIIPAEYFPKATDHIDEMIRITDNLLRQGYAYEVNGNVYFDVSKFQKYGALSGNVGLVSSNGASRIETDVLKDDPRDFTLWKKAEPGRELVWDSPWGKGFPGWHIECSAMSMKYLGDQIDIHTGGVDNIFPHHDDEIAQSDAFTGLRVVRTWVHGQHILADGVKMSKSSGNSFTLPDIESHGIDPIALRYLCLTARYGTRLDFTFTSLRAAQKGLSRLYNRVWEWNVVDSDNTSGKVLPDWEGQFLDRVNDNLDMPSALALTWDLAHSDLPRNDKLATIIAFDRILGLGFAEVVNKYQVSPETIGAIEHRSGHRNRRDYFNADAHRTELFSQGYVIEDGYDKTRVRPKTNAERQGIARYMVSSSRDVASLIGNPDEVDVTVAIVGGEFVDELDRCVNSVLRWSDGISLQLIIVDNGSNDDTAKWLDEVTFSNRQIYPIFTDHVLGDAAAKNIALKQSLGRTIVVLDVSVEIQGDVFGPIEEILLDETIGVVGPLGLWTNDMHDFHDTESGDVDAMQTYLFAFRRRRLSEVGLMRESFRFYRNLDLDYSFHFKGCGYRIVADNGLAIKLHEHRQWVNLGENERDKLSRKNFRRFHQKWGHRTDLLANIK